MRTIHVSGGEKASDPTTIVIDPVDYTTSLDMTTCADEAYTLYHGLLLRLPAQTFDILAAKMAQYVQEERITRPNFPF